MARKKKGAPATEPEQPKTEAPMQSAIAPLAAPPQNGQAKAVEESPEFMAMIKARAVEVAKECGLKEPFMLNGPDRVDYPRQGHGYIVMVKEETGKQRLGSARFTSAGVHSYWSLDGIVTG